MKTGGHADTGIIGPPLTKESALVTQPPIQSAHLPNTGVSTAAQDPFVGGKMQGALRTENNLAGCLLEDTANGFNNLSRLGMLWTVSHRWLAASRFAFNYYSHFSKLLIRVPGDRTPCIILSKEGFTQGDPMDMPLYSVMVAVLDNQLKQELPAPM